MPEKSILIVDDDTHINEMVGEALKLEGYVVRQAGSAEEALDILKNQSVSLILLDLLLPGKKGWQLADELQNNPATKKIPIIIVSILSPADTELNQDNPSVTGYICKPFDLSTLVQEVKKHAPQ